MSEEDDLEVLWSRAEQAIQENLYTISRMACPFCGLDWVCPVGGGWLLCASCDTHVDPEQVLETVPTVISKLPPDQQVRRDRRLDRGLPG